MNKPAVTDHAHSIWRLAKILPPPQTDVPFWALVEDREGEQHVVYVVNTDEYGLCETDDVYGQSHKDSVTDALIAWMPAVIPAAPAKGSLEAPAALSESIPFYMDEYGAFASDGVYSQPYKDAITNAKDSLGIPTLPGSSSEHLKQHALAAIVSKDLLEPASLSESIAVYNEVIKMTGDELKAIPYPLHDRIKADVSAMTPGELQARWTAQLALVFMFMDTAFSRP